MWVVPSLLHGLAATQAEGLNLSCSKHLPLLRGKRCSVYEEKTFLMELRKEKTGSWVKVARRDLATVRNFDGKEKTWFLTSFSVPLNHMLPSDSRPFKSFAGKCRCPVPLLWEVFICLLVWFTKGTRCLKTSGHMHNQNDIIKMLMIANPLQTYSLSPAVRDVCLFKTQMNAPPLAFPPKMFCHISHYFFFFTRLKEFSLRYKFKP